jgi:3-methyladenine DNA glycosylase AlkD
MTVAEVMKQLESMGSEQTRKTLKRHGCPEPLFGVKIGDMKTIVKKVKKDTALAKDLYKTGNSDAMYLAGMLADGAELSRKDLDQWANSASWHMLSGATIPAVAVEHPQGWDAAMKWIDSPKEHLSVAGWGTLTGFVCVKPDDELDLTVLEQLIARVEKTIHASPDRTRYAMNNFVIAAGVYVKPLTEKAVAAGKRIGKVEVDMGDTACKVPVAPDYIRMSISKGQHGKKRKTMRC